MTVARHSWRSLQGKPSASLRLPPAWLLAAVFGLFVAIGLFIYENDFATGLFFPPVLTVAAVLPPLLAVAWFMNQQAEGLTWRRGLVALAGGATVSVAIAIVLEILFPVVVLTLVFGLGDFVTGMCRRCWMPWPEKTLLRPSPIPALFTSLSRSPSSRRWRRNWPSRWSRCRSWVASPAAMLSWSARWPGPGLPRWRTCCTPAWVMAFGPGFWSCGPWAARFTRWARAWWAWAGATFCEANRMPGPRRRLVLDGRRHARAVERRLLLVITLAGARFFGELPPEINVLGLSAAGTTLAFLLVLGLAALWMGRAVARGAALPGEMRGRVRRHPVHAVRPGRGDLGAGVPGGDCAGRHHRPAVADALKSFHEGHEGTRRI